MLEKDTTYEITHINFGCKIKTNPPLKLTHDRLTLDGEEVVAISDESEWNQVTGDVLLRPGARLQGTDVIWQEPQIADELVEEWQPWWDRHLGIQDDRWHRVVQFAEAFFPKKCFELQPLTVSRWIHAVKTYKKSTARGPDGWSREDLFHMSPSFVAELLQLLNQIEQGSFWPKQTMQAIVVLLKKHQHARLVGEHRPIVLMSLIYRVWSGIRAKELLAQFADIFEHHSYGFLPKRGTIQYWWTIQSAIELALQTGEGLSGMTADIVKAYSYVLRRPIYQLAKIMGVPMNVLLPWQNAHHQLIRRFKIRDYVSKGVSSVTGLPEGDPLSCFGMLLCNFHFHLYCQRYLPNVHAFSFVDNLALVSTTTDGIMQGKGVMDAWLNAFDLQIDGKKTYVWSTKSHDRGILRQTGYAIKTGAKDLGAQFQYGPKREASIRNDRLQSIQHLWSVLARSGAPLSMKIKGVITAVWPRALHASSGVFMPEAVFTTLRSGAMRGLKLNKAGSSPLVRLGLLHQPMLDPACYHWKRVLLDVRQMCQKMEGIQETWSTFIEDFDGKIFSGPLSTLIQLSQTLGWEIQKDFRVLTSTKLSFDLARASWTEVELIFLDSWRQVLTDRIRERDEFAGLVALNPQFPWQRVGFRMQIDWHYYDRVRMELLQRSLRKLIGTYQGWLLADIVQSRILWDTDCRTALNIKYCDKDMLDLCECGQIFRIVRNFMGYVHG